jgi:hypothetical protein
MNKTARISPPLSGYGAERSQPPVGTDSRQPAPAATGVPQDVPLGLPLADPAKPIETISVGQAANIVAKVDAQADPQNSGSDFQPLPTTDSPLPDVNTKPHIANPPAAESVIQETIVSAKTGVPPQVSKIEAANAVQTATAAAKPLSNETQPQTAARAVGNFKSPIQIPSSPPAVNHSPQAHAPIPASASAPNSNAQASPVIHVEISHSKASPSLPTSSSSKAGSMKTEPTSSVQSANQSPRLDESFAANPKDPKAQTIKAGAPAKSAANDSSAPQNSCADPKAAAPLPFAATAVTAIQGNSHADSAATNAGPLITGVQSAANSGVKPDASPTLVKTEPALENRPQPEPAQAPVARIFHNPSQSEMRVGLRTESFGVVDVHTTISEKQVEVAMGSERGDLKGFMAPELPVLQSNLQQHDLRLQTLRTFAPAYTAQSDVFSGAGGQPKDSQRQNHGLRREIVQRLETTPSENGGLWAPRSGLSVRI